MPIPFARAAVHCGTKIAYLEKPSVSESGQRHGSLSQYVSIWTSRAASVLVAYTTCPRQREAEQRCHRGKAFRLQQSDLGVMRWLDLNCELEGHSSRCLPRSVLGQCDMKTLAGNVQWHVSGRDIPALGLVT